MAYTWTNKTKTGGVGLTGKIVQKGKDDFPLMYASDLDWANVEVESGVNLNTTDDLLDYIKGGNRNITDRIDELELSNAGYEIRCDKSVCYVGDTLSRVPIYVYKNGTLLNWSNILADGITLKSPITKPSGAIDLILFTSNGQWLAGTANVAGTYVFEFLKNNVVVASFRFIVLMKAYRSTIVTAYKSSSELPSKPQGASYNFGTTPGTLTMGNDGWVTSPTGLSGTVWFCTGYVSEGAPSSIDWNEPCIYLTEEIVMQEADHRVKEIAIYKAEKTGTSATTPTGGSYSFSANSGEGSFTCPTEWSLEPNAAVTAYKSSAATADQDNYKIWKSYNSYQCTVTGDTTLTYGTVTESGWTTPVIYLDIDGILNDADTRAQAAFDASLGSASTDLQRAAELIENTQPLIDAVNAIFAWRIIGDGTNALDSKYIELVDTNGTDTDMDDLHDLFDGYYSSSNNRYEGTIEGLNSNPNICISSMEFKAIKFGSITDLNSSTAVTNKWVAYIPTTTEIRTQIASLSNDLSQLNTTVNQQTPEWIRLQASKGFLDKVTWTMVPEAEYTSATNKVDLGSAALPTTEYVASTNTSGYRYGYYYKRTESGVSYWYRCDYPISTGFANILANRVSFGVTNNLSGSDSVKGALIDMTVDGVSITGDKIVLNGDAIANAIAGKSLNINNTSYINGDGSVYFGMPSNVNLNELSSSAREAFLSTLASAPVSSRFNSNGSGLLCGGNISWMSNGSLYVKSAYIGSNNEWAIKSTNTSPAIPIIYSKDSSTNQELYISPQYLKSIAAPSTEVPNPNPDWEIHRDGSATFAHGKAVFNAGGSFHIGGASNEVYNVLVTENGQTVTRQEHAGYIDYVPGTGLLTISGDRVNIASNTMAQIGAGLSQDNDFVGLIATQAGVDIKGDLNTEDLSVGNGACFFKGTDNDSAETNHGVSYPAHSRGAGHLANGNIWWNNNGDVSVKGNIEADSMKINAVADYSDELSLGTGKMWFTNYGSAKDISHGVIQNASVTLEDSDPVILFKSVRGGTTSFFVLNPLLLGNGSTTVTPLFTNLNESIASNIDQLIDLKLSNRWQDTFHIDTVSGTSAYGTSYFVFEKSSSNRYLYSARVVLSNCLIENEDHYVIHVPYDGRLLNIYDKIIELTRFEISLDEEQLNYKKIFIYPAYTCSPSSSNYSVVRKKNNGILGYYISRVIESTDSLFNKTVVDVNSGNEINNIGNDKKYLMIDSRSYNLMLNSSMTSTDFDDFLDDSSIQGTIDASSYQTYSNTQIDNYASGLNS